MQRLTTALCMAAASLPAFCQSSLTLFGTVDLNLTRAKAGADAATFMDQGGNRVPSRLGLRGSEDLGGGLAASFWLESALLPDTGAIAGAFFGRRSTLSLSSASWGELRLGRDYVPTLWNISAFTPLGTVGVGGAANIIFGWPNGHANAKTAVRASNSIGYHLPRTASGLYGQAMHAWGEGVDGTRYTGARIGWAAGPVDVAAAYGVTPAQGARYRTWTVGGTWLMEPVKLFANYHRHARLDDAQANITLGLSIGLGGGQLLASVARSDRKGPAVSADDARQVALGYVHPLSRRTDLYGTYAAIRNEGKASFATAGTPAGVAGQSARGIQFGVTHRF